MNNYKVPPRKMIPPVYAAEGFDGSYDAPSVLENIATALGIDVDKLKQSGIAVDDYLGTAARLAQEQVGLAGPTEQVKYQDLKATSQLQSALEKQYKDPVNAAVNIAQLLGKISTPKAIIAKELGAPFVKKVGAFLSEHGDIGKDKRAADAARTLGVNPIAKEYASVGDYGIDDTDPTMGAIPGNYSPPASSIASTKSNVLDMVNQAAQTSLAAKEAQAAQQKAATYNDKDFDNALSAAIAEEIGTSVPATTAPASSVASTAATYNDKDSYSSSYSNDAGHNAPSGGYKGYSGDDVEASYSPSSDSGSSSGGK